jgi:hypothetical protein
VLGENPGRVAERAWVAKLYRPGEPAGHAIGGGLGVGGERHVARLDDLVVLAKAAVDHLDTDV